MNDYSKILVKVIFTLLENISALFLLFYFIWPDFVSFRFVSQNSISLIKCIMQYCTKCLLCVAELYGTEIKMKKAAFTAMRGSLIFNNFL